MTESSSQNANPTESALINISQRLTQQEQTLPLLMEQLSASNQRYTQLEALVRQIHESLSQPHQPPPPVGPSAAVSEATGPPRSEEAPPMENSHFRVAPSPPSVTFGGEFEECYSFILQCKLAFERCPAAFSSDSAKISYVVGLLRGRALRWAEARSHNDLFLNGSFNDFLTELKLTFGCYESSSDINKRLLKLSQGRKTVADLAVDFRILAARTTWNDDALIGAFTEALNDKVRDQLALCPEPSSLDELIRLAISIDKRQRELRRHEPEPPVFPARERHSKISGRPVSEPPSSEEPMQMGRTRLTPEEREYRQKSGLCMYCGTAGHFVNSCPALLKGRARH
uniref:CCHC-type domain-containing protein n=2 Tax=Nothobranchius furzeri TaxID=105023 RepID=A0A1A8A2Q5_NOTFU